MKKAFVIFIAVITMLTYVVPVIAIDDSSEATDSIYNSEDSYDNANSDLDDSDDITIDYDNDPQCYRYQNNGFMFKSRAISGANNITHNPKFNSAKKIYGIDVSYHNSTIDWNKVKSSGIDFAVIRVGYRGYGNGQIVLDSKFVENLKNARATGIGVGLYFYTQAINNKEAQQEAEFVLRQIKGTKLELPIYYDIEEVYGASGRLDNANLSYSAKTSLCRTFCDTIQKGGYRAGVYASYNWLTKLIDGKALGGKYDVWIAHTANSTPYKNDYDMWQYSWSGSVPGILTNVDMNVMYLVKNPAKVTNFKGTQNGSQADLSWNASFGAYGYSVYAKNLDTNVTTEICKTTGTAKRVPIPYAHTRFFVKAYYKINNDYCYSDYSNGINFYSRKASNLKVDASTYYGTDGFDLTWTAVEGASGYQIHIYDNEQKKYVIAGYTNTNRYNFRDLDIATEYTVRVRAYFNEDNSPEFKGNDSIHGEISDPLIIGTKTERTQNFQVISNKTNSLTVKWDKISERCDGYEIMVIDRTTNKKFSAGTVNKNQSQFEIKNLIPGNIYDINVHAYYISNKTKYVGLYSNLVTTATVCLAPQNIKASKIGRNNLTLTWSKANGASSYVIYEKINGKIILVGNSKTNSYTISNLESYSKHIYYVKASKMLENKQFFSGYSSQFYVNLAAKPSKLSVLAYDNTAVKLAWNNVSGADKYEIYFYNTANKTFTLNRTVKATSCIIGHLKKNTSYVICIKAVYGNRRSDYSEGKVISTKPITPTGMKFNAIGRNAQTISWKKISGATHYWIYRYEPKTRKYYRFKIVGNVSSTTLTGLRQNMLHRYYICAVKYTPIKTYVSAPSSTFYAWTKK